VSDVCAMNMGTLQLADVESQVLTLGAQNIKGPIVYLTTKRNIFLESKVL